MALIVLLIGAALMSWWGRTRQLKHAWLAWLPFAAPVIGSIGLVYTLVGLQQSFNAVQNVAPAEKATQLAQGISTAMNATALGLGGALLVFFVCAVIYARAPQGSRDTTVG